MIKIETITVANLSRAKIGERFEFHGQTYRVQSIDGYENGDGLERVVVTLKTYCRECGAAFELTASRRPKWLKKSCGRNHATAPWTRQRATSSPCAPPPVEVLGETSAAKPSASICDAKTS